MWTKPFSFPFLGNIACYFFWKYICLNWNITGKYYICKDILVPLYCLEVFKICMDGRRRAVTIQCKWGTFTSGSADQCSCRKMSSDKIPDKSCDSHCVPESKPHRSHRDFFRHFALDITTSPWMLCKIYFPHFDGDFCLTPFCQSPLGTFGGW